MDSTEFRRHLDDATPPAGISPALRGLWWDHRGDWQQAHECAQEVDDTAGAAVHAYLHRKEGDLPNARYWYARAGRKVPNGTLEQEWDELASLLAG